MIPNSAAHCWICCIKMLKTSFLWIKYVFVCFVKSARINILSLCLQRGTKLLLHTQIHLDEPLNILVHTVRWRCMLCICFISRNSGKVSWKGHFYLVRNENPFREDSLPFRNLYTRNPIGLTHCAAESLINPYSMQWMHLINGFGPLSCLITWSRPSVMTAGSELEAITNPAKHAARELCVHVHICNYVHIWKALSHAIGCMC